MLPSRARRPTGFTGQTIRKTYTVDASTSPASGTWKLRVSDVYAGSTGTIGSWTLTF
ncbi:proprotein convertase P-domain-containing protein [Streptomyces sp. NPDC127036]|uniref:proprotein convertase P-domain-containing protein n=1 Tax=Streptomyces sp. NPDC127036 TaxID=3347112 RepID=UPI00365A7A0A